MLSHYLLDSMVVTEKSDDKVIEEPLYMINSFSLAYLKILSSPLSFVICFAYNVSVWVTLYLSSLEFVELFGLYIFVFHQI